MPSAASASASVTLGGSTPRPRAIADVRERPSSGVPAHLRDAHYQGAAKLGHGSGYEYPHDDPRGWVAQDYRPDDVAGRTYYEPSRHGYEEEVRKRMDELHGTGGGS